MDTNDLKDTNPEAPEEIVVRKKHRYASPRKHKTGFTAFTKVWAWVCVVVTASFIWIMIASGFLPLKYLIAIILAVAVFCGLVFPALFFLRFSTKARKTALAASVLLLAAAVFLGFNLSKTTGFIKTITASSGEYSVYYVNIPDSGNIKTVKDLSGKSCAVYMNKDLSYSDARNKLHQKVSVDYTVEPSLSRLGKDLLSGSASASSAAASNSAASASASESSTAASNSAASASASEFSTAASNSAASASALVSKTHYDTLCSKINGFRSHVRILYRFSVPIDSEISSTKVNVTKESYNILLCGLGSTGKISKTDASNMNMIISKRQMLTHIQK